MRDRVDDAAVYVAILVFVLSVVVVFDYPRIFHIFASVLVKRRYH